MRMEQHVPIFRQFHTNFLIFSLSPFPSDARSFQGTPNPIPSESRMLHMQIKLLALCQSKTHVYFYVRVCVQIYRGMGVLFNDIRVGDITCSVKIRSLRGTGTFLSRMANDSPSLINARRRYAYRYI